jgi:periplasmic mercuric ion binding protein
MPRDQFVLIVLGFVMFMSTVVGQAHAAPPEPAAKKQVVTLAVEGMATPTCPVLVRKALNKVEGVTRVEASLETKSADVEFVQDRVTVDAIRKIIKDQVGFETRVVKVSTAK